VEHESSHRSHISFTVTRLHIESVKRKPSMEDLSPAWRVKPEFVEVDYPFASNLSENMTPPLIPHTIHQVGHVTCTFN